MTEHEENFEPPTGENRYSRQILFSPVGAEGQAKIGAARVLIAGCGALGSVSADLLARAGVGFLRIADRDVLDFSNLQRQSLYDEQDVRDNLPKAAAAARRLEKINSTIKIEPIVTDIGPHNIIELMKDIDVVVDGLDNFEARYLINDACVREGVPWVYGGCVGSYGLAAAIVPGKTPCLRCLFPDQPEMGATPTCDTDGVLGPIAHIIASIQAAQALRLIVSGEAAGGLVTIDVWDGRYDRLDVAYHPETNACSCCAGRKFDFLDAPGTFTTPLCGRNSILVCPETETAEPDMKTLVERLKPLGEVSTNDYLLRFSIAPYELTLFNDGRVIVKGTEKPVEARSLIARYFGS